MQYSEELRDKFAIAAGIQTDEFYLHSYEDRTIVYRFNDWNSVESKITDEELTNRYSYELYQVSGLNTALGLGNFKYFFSCVFKIPQLNIFICQSVIFVQTQLI